MSLLSTTIPLSLELLAWLPLLLLPLALLWGGRSKIRQRGTPFDRSLGLGAPIRMGALRLYPIYGPRRAGTVDRIRPPRGRRLRIRENGQDETEIQTITVDNRGGSQVLLLGGLALRGGWQDRQIDRDVLVGPGSQQRVATLCIEHGRWSSPWWRRDRFVTSGRLVPASTRALTSPSDGQAGVWERIEQLCTRYDRRQGTGTLFAVLNHPQLRLRNAWLRRRLRRRLRRLPWSEHVVGIAYGTRHTMVGARWFASHTLFRRFRDSLLDGATTDALVAAPLPGEGANRLRYRHVRERLLILQQAVAATPRAEAKGTMPIDPSVGQGHAIFDEERRLVAVDYVAANASTTT
ncbi:MAG: DUF6569 family protein [Myxococcota bacterium]